MAIVRYTRDQIEKMRMTPEDWARLDAMTPEEIEQNAIDDPDNPPSTDEELQRGWTGRFVRQTREATGLSQEKFADRFDLNVARLRDWEQGRYLPDSFAMAFLKVIRKDPRYVEEALTPEPAPTP
jgi:putative transcriptional regulator